MGAIRRYLPQPPPEDYEIDTRDPDANAWLIVYLDVMTLMLSVFVVLLAYASFAPNDYRKLTRTLAQPVAVQGEVKTPVEPVVQKQQEEAAIDRPVEVQAEAFQQRFREALGSSDLQDAVELSLESDRINLQINERILFEQGRADLTDSGADVLAQLVPLLQQAGEESISVEGHTDPIPIANERFPSNWELSTHRATVVLRYLIGQGIAAIRLRAIGYADTRPIAANDSDAGRARNRRVSLVIHMDPGG